MKHKSILFCILFVLLFAVPWKATASSTHLMGTITIYVDEQKTFYRNSSYIPSNYYVSDDGWFLRQKTGSAWSDGQEFYDVKIISKNSQSCTLLGLQSNYDAYGLTTTELHCKGTRQSIGEYEEMVWKIEVKSYGSLRVEASPAGGTVDAGTKVTLTATSNGNTVSGCDIYYTLDGSTPTKSSTKYTSSGVTIDKSCWLNAKAFKTGYESFHIDEWYYTVKVPATSISLNKTSAALYTTAPDNTVQLTATVYPSDATDKSVSWSSSNNSVATVSNSGLVTAKAEGTTTITCKANDGSGVSETCSITVEKRQVYPSSISGVINSLSMKVDDVYTLSWNYEYPGGTVDDEKVKPNTTWSSDNAGVAKVSPTGVVTAVSTGFATITIKSENGISASCAVTVIEEAKPLNKNIKMMVAYVFHSLLLADDGTLWACGSNGYGQLGNGDTAERATPVQVMSDVASVAAGGWHSLILKTDGTLWSCGFNSRGQLGDGTTTNRTTPVQVMSGVASIAAGNRFSLILKTDGTLWACGENFYGQLGDGTTTNRTTPVQVMSGVVSIAAGGHHSLILKTDGTLWACGYNYHGGLGDGTTIDRTTPVQVMSGVASMAARGYHSLILKTDGTLWACGSNSDGQLGDGTTTGRTTPVQVMSGVASMAAGAYHSLILKTDGTLWVCGSNSNGQLGDGTTIGRTSPMQIMSGVTSIEAGRYHSLILKTDGTLWTCGRNDSGQLGDGTNIDRHTPVKIAENTSSSIMGTGTEADPFNSAAANEFASSLGADIPTEQVYYVKGKVVSIKEQFGTQYGNATFYISDDGTTANQFYIYKAKYLGNKKYAGEDLKLNVGDEVVVCGKLVNYIGTLPGTVQDEAYVVSINGTKGSTYERGDVNGDGVVNIADLMMLVNILTAK